MRLKNMTFALLILVVFLITTETSSFAIEIIYQGEGTSWTNIGSSANYDGTVTTETLPPQPLA